MGHSLTSREQVLVVFGVKFTVFYILCIDRGALCLIGYVYVCKNLSLNLTIRFADKQTLLLKHLQHRKSVFTLPAAN